MLTKDGIKPHLEKVQAIVSMKTPKTLKEVQRLSCGIASVKKIHPKMYRQVPVFLQVITK